MSTPEAIVVGGGPAGSVAALVLARQGRSVLLIDAGAESGPPVGESLPPAARPLLADLGLWERIARGPHLVCPGNVSFWGGPEAVCHDFLRDPHGPGWHLDRQAFDADLRAAAAEAGATVRCGVRVRVVEPSGAGWRVRLRPRRLGSGGEEVSCRFLVDATGRASVVARRLGGHRRRDDRLIAFAAHFRPAAGASPDRPDRPDRKDREARTWIEAAPDGWWTSTLLPSGERLVVFHTDSDLTEPVDRAALTTIEGFVAALADAPALAALLEAGGHVPAGRPHGLDAGSARLDRPAGAGWLAVGDAALSFDPLSSQGLFNACYTGLRGAEAASAALAGAPGWLAAYEERIGAIYRAYLAHRASYYVQERRWAGRPFWRRRHLAAGRRVEPERTVAVPG